MSKPTESYRKVQYDLRPAKQVERRMLVDAFQSLALGGFAVENYQYTGMGSVYFVDFVMFHRLLGITRMLSVEHSHKARTRVEFNRPFGCVDIKMGDIGEVIPDLSKDRQHILWLDYDSILASHHVRHASLAGTRLSVGSIVLITVDIEPPSNDDDPATWREYFIEEAGEFADKGMGVKGYGRSRLPAVNAQILERAIQSGIVGRPDVEFMPLFNFVYADGHQMLTMGGMICTNNEKRAIRATRLVDAAFYRPNLFDPPYEITVPRLTRKERLHLDAAMPCADDWRPTEFDIDPSEVESYRRIYRFLPTYAELLI